MVGQSKGIDWYEEGEDRFQSGGHVHRKSGGGLSSGEMEIMSSMQVSSALERPGRQH